MSSDSTGFTKENLDRCLAALGKEFRKRNGMAMPAELVLIGGAAVLENYGFREITYDVDAIIQASSAMKEAVNHVGDALGLPNGWLNMDFVRTTSYTPKLLEHSVYYRTFSNILTVRTIRAEYLIAMKLVAGRSYKNDWSDVVGILMEHKEYGDPIGMEQIDKAIHKLYGGWDSVSQDSREFIEDVLTDGNYVVLYKYYREEEKMNKAILLNFDQNYPDRLKGENINDILQAARAKKQRKEQ
ncbi:MAG: hypothetical protein FWF10_11980 [Clostridiales bacterium]|nr:hypothetical protein [Clostridiales bacterium]